MRAKTSKSRQGEDKMNLTTTSPYTEDAFVIEVVKSAPQATKYSRGSLQGTSQYSTSGKIEKSLTYVIKRK